MSILFHATEKTQKPFLKNLVKGRNKYISNKNSLENYLKKIYIRCLETLNPKKEFVEILIRTLKLIDYDDTFLKELQWHSKNQKFYSENDYSYNQGEGKLAKIVYEYVEEVIKIENIDQFTELEIRANLDLIRGLLLNNVQYDNINPLLSRIESISVSLKKIINIVEEADSNKNNSSNLEVISLKNCNQEIKKMFPILLAKEYFKEHKKQNEKEVKQTFHLIIDEAHNILSQQSNREAESWKDYRLELFEEIIKESRKFGFFLTVASQRPADISETIMSQFHNFFIHRLINEKDVRLIDNVISTLDRSSKQLIPVLPQGACIVTGTAFEFPKIIQVDKIENREERPNSDDIDLEELWEKNEEIK